MTLNQIEVGSNVGTECGAIRISKPGRFANVAKSVETTNFFIQSFHQMLDKSFNHSSMLWDSVELKAGENRTQQKPATDPSVGVSEIHTQRTNICSYMYVRCRQERSPPDFSIINPAVQFLFKARPVIELQIMRLFFDM